MKLKNKLIPLAGVAAVCATVAPFSLTACGNDNNNKVPDGYIDVTQRYTPKSAQYDEFEWNLSFDDANDYYSRAVSLNPEIFKEDLYWSFSNSISTYQHAQKPNNDEPEQSIWRDIISDEDNSSQSQEEIIDAGFGGTPISHYIKVENVDIKRFPEPESYAYDMFLASFDLSYEIDYVYTSKEAPVKNLYSRRIVGESKFVNIPFYISYSERENLWLVKYSGYLLWYSYWTFWKNQQWSIDCNYVRTDTFLASSDVTGPSTTVSVTNGAYKLNADQWYNHRSLSLDAIADYIDEYVLCDCVFYSYHMYGVGNNLPTKD